MNVFSPKYNVLRIAYSSLGYRHSEETLVKVRSNLEKVNLSKSVKVKVTNLETNVSVEYISIREAAKSLNASRNTLKRYVLNSKPYKGIYKLECTLTESSYNSNYLNHPRSIEIEVMDLELNTVTRYTSISAAGRALNIGHVSIATYLKRNQKSPYKGRYVFKYTAI